MQVVGITTGSAGGCAESVPHTSMAVFCEGGFGDFKHVLGYSAFPLTPSLFLYTIPSE